MAPAAPHGTASIFSTDALHAASCRFSSWDPGRLAQQEQPALESRVSRWEEMEEHCKGLEAASLRITDIDLSNVEEDGSLSLRLGYSAASRLNADARKQEPDAPSVSAALVGSPMRQLSIGQGVHGASPSEDVFLSIASESQSLSSDSDSQSRSLRKGSSQGPIRSGHLAGQPSGLQRDQRSYSGIANLGSAVVASPRFTPSVNSPDAGTPGRSVPSVASPGGWAQAAPPFIRIPSSKSTLGGQDPLGDVPSLGTNETRPVGPARQLPCSNLPGALHLLPEAGMGPHTAPPLDDSLGTPRSPRGPHAAAAAGRVSRLRELNSVDPAWLANLKDLSEYEVSEHKAEEEELKYGDTLGPLGTWGGKPRLVERQIAPMGRLFGDEKPMSLSCRYGARTPLEVGIIYTSPWAPELDPEHFGTLLMGDVEKLHERSTGESSFSLARAKAAWLKNFGPKSKEQKSLWQKLLKPKNDTKKLTT